jgi:tetratricopeptide (TPR) repeat protein
MRRRLLLVTLLFASFIAWLPVHSSFAKSPENAPPPIIESLPPSSETSPAPVPTDERRLPELLPRERADAVMELNELRSAVLVSPDSAGDRLKLAQALYRIGDLDAAIEECRVALKLKSNNARAYLQLGIILMAKQDGHAAAITLMEAIMLDPELTHAHYSLGSVQYARQSHSGYPILSPSLGVATELSRRPLSSCVGLEASEPASGSSAIDGRRSDRRGASGAVLHGERLS